jgi:hypothetical protein
VKYRKKPVVIDAFQLTRNRGTGEFQHENPDWFQSAVNAGTAYYQGGSEPYYTIETLEGDMKAGVGDWIIKGVKGEIYPCKADIFAITYDPA